MKPAPFDYLLAETSEEALHALAQYGDEATIIAGGQSLLAMLNMRLAQPQLVIDIARIETLDSIQLSDEYIQIGAATTQAQFEAWPQLAQTSPLLTQAIPYIGHFQTRNRGTVCGSIAHADPSSELPLCLALLNGQVILGSENNRRVLHASDFQIGMLETAREAEEMIEAVCFPVCQSNSAYAFNEVARRHGDFAIIAIAAAVSKDSIRIAVAGVADKPTVRDWPWLEGDACADALNEFAWDLQGYDDNHATARYRRELVRRIGRRTIEEAKQRCPY